MSETKNTTEMSKRLNSGGFHTLKIILRYKASTGYIHNGAAQLHIFIRK